MHQNMGSKKSLYEITMAWEVTISSRSRRRGDANKRYLLFHSSMWASNKCSCDVLMPSCFPLMWDDRVVTTEVPETDQETDQEADPDRGTDSETVPETVTETDPETVPET
ncbi:unnamed protein product [Boreogadus saida]